MGECYPYKVEAVGSSPSRPTKDLIMIYEAFMEVVRVWSIVGCIYMLMKPSRPARDREEFLKIVFISGPLLWLMWPFAIVVGKFIKT